MIGGFSGKGGLQFRKTGRQLIQRGGTVQILQEHIGAIGSLDAVQFIVDGLIGADDKVHLAVGHFQPGLLALIIIIGEKGIGHLEKIVTDAGLDGDVGSGAQEVCHLLDLVLIGIVIPDSFQLSVFLAADEGIRAIFGRVLERVKFLGRHVGGIEVCTGRLGAIAFQERLVVNTVPGAVVHLGESAGGRILQVGESFFGTETLFPVDGIGLVCCKTV